MPTRRLPDLVVALFVMALLAGCGDDPAPTKVTATDGQTVRVIMTDNKFSIDALVVKVGSTVHFVFENRGMVGHEAVIGDQAMQDMHTSNGAHDMDPASTVEVPQQATGRLTYTFSTPGNLIVGCHQPGHYEAGMEFAVQVVP